MSALTARACCPRCTTALDGGPIVYRCGPCRRAVYAADLDTEFVPRRSLAMTGGVS